MIDARFEVVRVGSLLPAVFYLAKSPKEYRELGGVLLEQEHPVHRSLRCMPVRIDRETGVMDLTVMPITLDGRREGRTLYGIPFKDPSGSWPFVDEAGGTWHFITS